MPKRGTFLVGQDKQPLDHIINLFSLENDDQTVIQLTRTYCLDSPSLDVQKKGMEFLYINGLYEDLQFLVHKNKASNHSSNEQWAEVYQIMLDRRTNRYSFTEILYRIHSFKTDDPALKCLLEFTKIAIYISIHDYRKVGEFLDRIEYLVEQVQDPFLMTYFQKRLNQILSLYYWVRNEVIIARKFFYQILNKTMNFQTKINTHINLGLSYAFDTYYQGMYHMEEALRISKQHQIPYYIYVLENNNIPFLSAHFNQVDGIHTEDKSEQAHIELAKGNNEKAISILEECPINTPFQYYYMGWAKQDSHLLLQSYESFIKNRSDYFFSRLPLNVLRQLESEK